jgi:hypothetical protein
LLKVANLLIIATPLIAFESKRILVCLNRSGSKMHFVPLIAGKIVDFLKNYFTRKSIICLHKTNY